MVILVLNCGSSSIKYQVIDMNDASSELLAKGIVERIGLPEGDLTHKPVGKDKFELRQPIPDHTTGISLVMQALTDPEHGVIASLDEVKAVGHRVAHGGEFFPQSCLVDDDVKRKIASLCQIAPLHNPASLQGIEAIETVLPGVRQVTVFDTSFHQTIPAVNYMFALPYAYYEKYRVRKYGFHGTSHKYVTQRAADMLGKPLSTLKLISCHLGNGSSIAAVCGGKSVDTSMGFTPLAGLPMGTRSGDLDAGILEFLMNKYHMDIKEMLNVLNKKSGVQGVSGVSSDFRDLCSAAEGGNQRAELALEMFNYSVKKYIGAYAAAMGGVDAIIFTAGVGENDSQQRMAIASGLEFMGVKMDADANNIRGKEAIISAIDSKVKVLLIPTNEELMIALDTAALA